MSPSDRIASVETLLAHSLAIEQEAAERYADLADQMEVHNNLEVASLFRRLAEIEGKHIAKVHEMGSGRQLPHISPWEYQWQGAESPEALHDGEAHYLMTPYHALSLALAGERRAAEFFARIAETATEQAVRELAAQLRDEEREHVVLVEQWLERYPKPEADWHDDPDPPMTHE